METQQTQIREKLSDQQKVKAVDALLNLDSEQITIRLFKDLLFNIQQWQLSHMERLALTAGDMSMESFYVRVLYDFFKELEKKGGEQC